MAFLQVKSEPKKNVSKPPTALCSQCLDLQIFPAGLETSSSTSWESAQSLRGLHKSAENHGHEQCVPLTAGGVQLHWRWWERGSRSPVALFLPL
ncbi:hypothetical protein Y1Q_0014079 [Alligator mississippiensis]|uniref:Uncharacterized protein n=1 Tax=Alligator mississippiensis TaxID=8496 RepID=A0A151MJS5_ALLMI|nr:hypothetical protein Y1Q_0014079 [Alligator mississippiensis]